MSKQVEPIEDTRWQPDNRLIAILEGLKTEAAKEKSAARFVKDFLPFGESQWSQTLSILKPARVNEQTGRIVLSYFDGLTDKNRDRYIEQLAEILDRIPRRRALDARIRNVVIKKTSQMTAIEPAIDECATKPGPERIIMIRNPTGGGKTMICNWLAAEKKARIVMVRDIWRDSEKGYVPLMDIANALEVPIKKGTGIAGLEDDIIKFCLSRDILLAFDEGEHFGRTALNKLKFLMNMTRIVVVICVTPKGHDQWFKLWENDAEQIARRTHALFELSAISAEDAGLFFGEDKFKDQETTTNYLIREASTFGHFSLLNRVAEKLINVTQARHEDVIKIVKSAQLAMRRPSPTTGIL